MNVRRLLYISFSGRQWNQGKLKSMYRVHKDDFPLLPTIIDFNTTVPLVDREDDLDMAPQPVQEKMNLQSKASRDWPLQVKANTNACMRFIKVSNGR